MDHTPGIRTQTDDDMKRLGQDKSRLHLIIWMERPGVKLFSTKMEYTYFPPRSGKNYLFEMVLCKWPAQSPMFYAVLSFPIEYRPQAEALAKECGLRIANGVPILLGGDSPIFFPMDGETVFTLENITGHTVYSNDQEKTKQLMEVEDQVCETILAADRQKFVQELLDQGYTNEQIERMFRIWDSGNEAYDEKPQNAKDGQHRHKGVK